MGKEMSATATLEREGGRDAANYPYGRPFVACHEHIVYRARRPRPPCAPSVARTISPSLSSSFMGKCQWRCHRPPPLRPHVYLRLSARNAASVTAVAAPHVECSRELRVHRLLAPVMTSAQLCALGIHIFAANMSSLVARYHPRC